MNGLYDEIRIALYRVWNRRWLALAVAWGICLLGWLVVALIPNTYASEAKLFVGQQAMLSTSMIDDRNDQRQQMDQIQQTLLSADNLEKVIRATKLGDNISSDREMATKIVSLRENIEVKSDQPNVFNITVKQSGAGRSDGEAAALARDIAQKIIDIFQEENIAGGAGRTSQALRFLDQQLADRQKELQDAEQKRVAFETQNLGLLPGAGSASQQLLSARAELSQIDSQLASAQSSLAALNGQLAGTPAMLSTPNPSGGGSQISQLQGQLASARARGWTDSHPDVIALKEQIASLRASGAGESGGGSFKTPNPAYSSLQSMQAERAATVSALRARKSALEADVSRLIGKQSAEPGVQAEYERISQDYDVLKQQYDKLLAERENMRLKGEVEEETDLTQFRVVNPPSMSRVPAAPNRPLLLAAVLVLGLAGGAGAAFALSQLRTSFPTAGSLEKASGLPVIGSISEMLTEAQRAARKRKLKLFFGGTGALAGVFLLLMMVEFIQRGTVA
ncbi:XrtA system polysaccharide chain length determinant [Novosphingopyxis sp. YJ-S2-01]|uniref:XrtA system polysaccharide chain length determinant n=1 Tax=Novosphingopyxis sp. YJ-S2-01 TaxID=2794021 RepID=UPI0018DBEB35|nr:XrtA system polysaccharide chain length determinant [Novosphingopyxis sp. YJ-S2-01]MBH9538243.1 chain-length determining protein [Novosphingopyxis sp. YJ-S2-01]